jgi:type IV pilus assembly protein PilQ
MQGIWREFDIAFNAMEQREKSKVLASPSVITIDGQKADISLTEDYPYISGRDDGGNAQWSLMTIGPKLSMTPKVGRDGVVTLDLDIATGDIIGVTVGSLGEEMPRTSTRSVKNAVRVRHGEPFVIGGLFREENRDTVTRIPILGRIPIFGEWLFSYRKKTHPRSQVVIIVVPYILDTPDVAINQEKVMIRQ